MISGFIIRLPLLGESNELNNAPEAESDPSGLYLARVRLVQAARGLDAQAFSAERLGWMSLWSRAYLITDNAIWALEGSARLSLAAANRAAIELDAHTRAILMPVLAENRVKQYGRGVPAGSESSWASTVDRLCAYVAWGLVNDRASLRKSLSRLSEVFDPEPAEQLRRNPGATRAHERLYGLLPTATRAQLREAKESARNEINASIDWINTLLNESGLAAWSSRAEALCRESPEKRTLFHLFGDAEASLAAKLKGDNLSLMYGLYSDTSSLLHGSSLREVILTVGSRVYPPASGRSSFRVASLRDYRLPDRRDAWTSTDSPKGMGAGILTCN